MNSVPSSKRKVTFRVISSKFFKKNQEWVVYRDVGCDVPGGARGQTIKRSYSRFLRFLRKTLGRRLPGVARRFWVRKKPIRKWIKYFIFDKSRRADLNP